MQGERSNFAAFFEGIMAYKAYITKISVSDHPDPEVHSIAVGSANGNTVVVSKKTQTGDLGIYFECDGQLSLEFAKANDLVRYKDPVTGENKGGFFDDNRKVRAQKFRGVKSDGFWIPVESLGFTGTDISALKEGDSFDELNGIPICNKFVTRATQKAANKEKKQRREEKFVINLPKHFDTAQFRNEAKLYKAGDVIYLSEKKHGTSQRLGCIEVQHIYRKFSFKWLKQKLGLLPQKTFENVIGTRNVTLDPIDEKKNEGKGYYADESFRQKVCKDLFGKLRKNEILFFEVVGWINEATPIMPPADIKALKEKSLKKYADKDGKMFYSYGANVGQCKMYVYRIANMQSDGKLVDMPFSYVIERCKELEVETVPLLCDPFIYDGDVRTLQNLVEGLTDGECSIDSRHIREGVCVRADRYPTPFVTKNKSFFFKLCEGMVKENEDYVDTEEAA